MYFVVTNIPGSFHTRDLRNYFSEYIEKEAYECFHFRRRPQSQLKDIIDSSRTKFSCQGGEQSQCSTVDSSGEEVAREGSSSAYDCETNKKFPQECKYSVDEPDGADAEPECGSSSSPHWLQGGLSSLTSIIQDKKKKAKYGARKGYDSQLEKHSCNLRKLQTEENCTVPEATAGKQHATNSVEEALAKSQNPNFGDRTCCILKVKENFANTFQEKYNGKYWVGRDGDVLPSKCFVLRVNIGSQADDDSYRTRKEIESRSFSTVPSLDIIEFRPPPLMPQGNVGTPTQHFKSLIRTCQLPGIIIKKLGLEFPRGRGRKRFSQVPFNYGTNIIPGSEEEDMKVTFTAAGHMIPVSVDFSKICKRPRTRLAKGAAVDLEEEREDGAEVEEWERYEAFHNDVTSQDRIKQRLYEEEIELVWEKGGSGLLFYTDAQYWKEKEGDFDEQTADEWDVDMSVYYEKGAGDKDAQDSAAMVTSGDLRAGKVHHSAFAQPHTRNSKVTSLKKRTSKSEVTSGKERKKGPAAPPAIGKFEEHTKGFGRRLMESQGWQDGQGLGRSALGNPYALDNDGQHPRDKKGFGYHGEKLKNWGAAAPPQAQHSRNKSGHFISTVFDREPDPPAPALRTPELTTLSHRQPGLAFVKATHTSEQE